MHMRLKVALAGVVLATSIVSAQQAVRPAQSAVEGRGTMAVKATRQTTAAAHKSARAIKSLINGVAVDSTQAPLPNTTIRLRNLEVNEIEQIITANELGEFSFVAQPNVPYVVEIADQAGRILAVGDVIVANVGEVAAAVVSLPSRLPALAGMFGDTARSVMTAATGTGLTVIDPTRPKVSPNK